MNRVWIFWILLLQIIIDTLILLNIPIVRQFVGFIFFTFIPGFLTVKVLRINRLDKSEYTLICLGFSIAFLMLAGLALNEIGILLSITQPLSLMPVLIVANSYTLICCILICLRETNNIKSSFGNPKRSSFVLIVPLLALPLLGIVGAIWSGINRINLLSLSLILTISLIFIVAVAFKNMFLLSFSPAIILLLALTLLYQATFISSYPISYGGDLARELFIFKNTLDKGYWETGNPYNDMRYGRLQSMLSVTILPTIYSNLLNLQPEAVFKILYTTIFAFVPLGLYVVWREKVGNKSAFISAFLFMAYETFYTEIFGLNRQMIAELFFVLLLFVIFNSKIISGSKRMVCFIIFSFALITSHYGIAEIFIFFISFTLVLLLVEKSISTRISLSMCILFFVIMFTWYIYTARSATFDSFVQYGDYVYRSLSDVFNLEAREPEVLRGLGLETPPTVWNALSRFFQYVVQFLIIVGFLALIINKKRTTVKLDKESLMLVVAAMILLVMLIVVPGLSRTMNMTRFFHILLFVVSPLVVIGAEFLAGLLKKDREFLASLLLIVILVPYFLFQTGFVYEIVGNNTWCLPLSAYRMPAYRSRGQLGLTDERDIICAEWLRVNINTHGTTVYGDNPSVSYALFAYCMIKKEDMIVLNNVTNIADNSVIYLSRLNTIDNIILGQKFIWNASEFPFPNDLSVIYTNGASEIFRK